MKFAFVLAALTLSALPVLAEGVVSPPATVADAGTAPTPAPVPVKPAATPTTPAEAPKVAVTPEDCAKQGKKFVKGYTNKKGKTVAPYCRKAPSAKAVAAPPAKT
jgi:hypothetical protein